MWSYKALRGASTTASSRAGSYLHSLVAATAGGGCPSQAVGASFCYFSTRTGRVKWYDVRKGYGFITPEDGSEDVFVHYKAVHANGGFKSLVEGEPVEYTAGVDARGRLHAERVTGPMGSFVQGVPRFFPNSNQQGGIGGRGGGMRRGGNGYQRQGFDPMDDDEDYSRGRPWSMPKDDSDSFSAGQKGVPPTADFHELDLPEDELDDNVAAEAEDASNKNKEERYPAAESHR